MSQPDSGLSVRIGGREIADSVVEIHRSDIPGHRETLWRGDTDGLARLVIELANVRAENRELRIMMLRARRALDV